MRRLNVLLAVALSLAAAGPAPAQDRARSKEVVIALGAEPRTMLAVTIVDWTTNVTASIVRGSAPRAITTSLDRARSWAGAGPAAASDSATARSTFRRRIEPPWVSSGDQGYNHSGQ